MDSEPALFDALVRLVRRADPDLLVGFATAIIAIKGGVEILRDARAETKKRERRSS